MRIGELARRTGVGVSTLRAWERRFHFLTPERTPAGQRTYDEADVARVHAVLRLVNAEGLSLPGAIARVASVGASDVGLGEAEALFYNQILEAVGHGVWVIREGRSRYVNRRMAEIMRYPIDELVAMDISTIFHPEELPLVRDRTEQVRDGTRLHFTQELFRGDGTTFLAEVHTTPLLNQARRYEGAVALVEDITDRHKAETEAQLRAMLLDSIGEAVTASTPDGTLVYVNPAAERLFGWRAEEVVGLASRDVFPTPEESAKEVARINAVLLSGKRYRGRFKMIRHDGTEFVAQLTTVPTRDKRGTHLGFVGVISDQTQREERDRRQQRRERQAETLALLSTHVLQRADPGRAGFILTEAMDATRRLLDVDHVSMFDVGADGDQLDLRAESPALEQDGTVLAAAQYFAKYTALAGKVIVTPDIAHDPRFQPADVHPGAPVVAALGAPVFGPTGVRGVVVAESSTADRFDLVDGHFIQTVANLIGVALAREP